MTINDRQLLRKVGQVKLGYAFCLAPLGLAMNGQTQEVENLTFQIFVFGNAQLFQNEISLLNYNDFSKNVTGLESMILHYQFLKSCVS